MRGSMEGEKIYLKNDFDPLKKKKKRLTLQKKKKKNITFKI